MALGQVTSGEWHSLSQSTECLLGTCSPALSGLQSSWETGTELWRLRLAPALRFTPDFAFKGQAGAVLRSAALMAHSAGIRLLSCPSIFFPKLPSSKPGYLLNCRKIPAIRTTQPPPALALSNPLPTIHFLGFHSPLPDSTASLLPPRGLW